MGKTNVTKLTKIKIDQADPGETVWDSEVVGFHVSKLSSGAGTFKFQYRAADGSQGKIKIGRYPSMTIDEARKIARLYRVEVDKGGNPSKARKEVRAAPTLAEYVAYYCDEYGPQKGLQLTTIRDARRVLERFALPKYGKCKIADLTARDILTMVSQARDLGSVPQANRLRAALSRVCTLAMRDVPTMVRNPVSGVGKYPEGTRRVVMGHHEVQRFLSACASYPDRQAANALLLLLYTGARKNEVLKAKWSQFDLSNAVWTKPVGHVKSKRDHTILLAPQSVELLVNMHSIRSSEWVFPGRDENKPRYDLKRPWKTICEAADLNSYRIHDLRRTLASFMISTQSDIATVGLALGHTQTQTTLRYAMLFPHIQQQGTTRAIDKMHDPLGL